jgi:pyruvate/2-oxoglutarate dehydrogenase complex dihydrolipoamide acyltransferase (E2) component
MRVAVEMPHFSADAVDGRVSAWNAAVGDRVRRGDVIAVIETDKAELDLEAMVSGVLVEIVHQVDAEVPVGEPIAYIETDAAG